MSLKTTLLSLFKYEQDKDGASAFNIKQALNDNWDKIDSWAQSIKTTITGLVPTSRKINNKSLTSDITLNASDVGAAASDHNHDTRYYTQAQIDTKMSNAGASTVSTHNSSTSAHSALFAKKQDKLTGAAGKLVGFTAKDTVGPVDAPSGIDAVDSAPSTAAQDSLSVDPDGIAYTGNASGAAVMQYGAANVTISDSEPSETLPEGHIWMVYE